LKTLGKEHPQHVPHNGNLWKKRLFPEPYLTYLSGSQIKEPSLQVPLTEILCFQRSPSMSPLQVLQQVAIDRDACFQSLLLHIP
jgi:hypothetical protein